MACRNGYAAVVCVLVASGLIEPDAELQIEAAKQLIRAPAPEKEDEGKFETQRAAARVAANWPGIEETLATSTEKHRLAWDELQYEATALRFAD